MPSALICQLKATSALQSYDFIFQQDSMKKIDQERNAFNFFHGNHHKHIISQLDLLVKGHGNYDRIYDREFTMVTARSTVPIDANVSSGSSSSSSRVLSLTVKDIFSSVTDTMRYISGKHFTNSSIAAPSKTKPNDKVTGRSLIDLARTTLRNVKKAVVAAEEWLAGGDLPSGKTWDDLYAHVLINHEENAPGEKCFIGFMAFVCLTKYNDGGKNTLTTLAMNDDDLGDLEGGSGREGARKKAKLLKDEQRSIETGEEESPFKTRGLTMDDRVQLIEVSQMEEQKWRDDLKTTWTQLNAKNDLLLRERSQAIELAKIICPLYDDEDEHWIAVMDLSKEITSVKKQINQHEKNRDDMLRSKNATTLLAQDFLKSVCNESRSPHVNTNVGGERRSTPISLLSEIEGSQDTLSVDEQSLTDGVSTVTRDGSTVAGGVPAVTRDGSNVAGGVPVATITEIGDETVVNIRDNSVRMEQNSFFRSQTM